MKLRSIKKNITFKLCYYYYFLYSTIGEAHLNNLHWTYLLTCGDASKHINTRSFSDFETILQLQLTQFHLEMLRSDCHQFYKLTHYEQKALYPHNRQLTEERKLINSSQFLRSETIFKCMTPKLLSKCTLIRSFTKQYLQKDNMKLLSGFSNELVLFI